MRTKLFLLTGLLCSGMIFVSCQKDNELTPGISQEQSVANQSSVELMKADFVEPDDDLYADPLSNYPDPFYNQTNIQFRVLRASKVTLVVYHENGMMIRRLYEGYLEKGLYKRAFDATGLPAGTYVAELKLGTRVCKEKMIKLNLRDPMPGNDLSEN